MHRRSDYSKSSERLKRYERLAYGTRCTALITRGKRFNVVCECLRYYGRMRPNWDPFVLHDGRTALTDGLRAQFPEANVVVFDKDYGRPEMLSYAYTWRALYFMRAIFDSWEYEKVIFCVDDLLIISDRMFSYVDRLRSGWTTFWCPRHSFPESSLQVVTADCEAFERFTQDGNFLAHDGTLMERALPYTEINREMRGDRYGELPLEQQPNRDEVDFWAQAFGEAPIGTQEVLV